MSSGTLVPNSLPIPLQEPISEAKPSSPLKGYITFSWVQWLTFISQAIGLSSTRVGNASLTLQSASVPATDIASTSLSAGLYEVRWYMRVTTAASVSSSFQVTWDWTESGTAQSYAAPAVTGNTTSTKQMDIQLMLKIDGSSPVRYTITYASVGTPMVYSFAAVLSSLQS